MKKLLLILPIPLAALAWWALYHRNLPPEVPFAKVKREKLVSTLPTNGKVEPIEWTTVRAETAGAVERTLVEQGRAISAGAVLVTLQASGAQADLAAAEARAAQARSELAAISQGGRAQELADIENGLARVRFDRQAAEKDAATLERLAGKQAATQAEVERARDRVRQSDIEIAALERKRAALVASTDRGVAEARLREAEIAARAGAPPHRAEFDPLAARGLGVFLQCPPGQLSESRRPRGERGPHGPPPRSRVRR